MEGGEGVLLLLLTLLPSTSTRYTSSPCPIVVVSHLTRKVTCAVVVCVRLLLLLVVVVSSAIEVAVVAAIVELLSFMAECTIVIVSCTSVTALVFEDGRHACAFSIIASLGGRIAKQTRRTCLFACASLDNPSPL
jgi:hypothetical protein